jgi:hypothetical protein
MRSRVLLASMNVVGATLACVASVLLDFVPFAVLEGAWAAVASIELVRARDGYARHKAVQSAERGASLPTVRAFTTSDDALRQTRASAGDSATSRDPRAGI